MLNKVVSLGALALAGLAGFGCSASAPGQTQADVNAFKGGPMPPDFAKKQAEILAETAAQRDAAMHHQPIPKR